MKKIQKKKADCALDWGKNVGTITYFSSQKSETLSMTDLMDLPNRLSKGTVIVAENTHFGCPRKKLSLSQPLVQEKLDLLHNNFSKKEIEIILFPEKLTPTARQFSGIEEKTDRNDTLGLLNYYNSDRCVTTTRKYSVDTAAKKQTILEGHTFKSDLDMYLNYARSFEYRAEDDHISKWVREILSDIVNHVSKEVLEIFGLDDNAFYKRGNQKLGIKKGDINFNNIKMSQIYPIAAMFISYEGNIRKRLSTKDLVGWYFAQRYVYHFSPWHLRAGVARSNFFHHGIRNYTKAKLKEHGLNINKKKRGNFTDEEDRLYRHYRQIYCNAIKKLFTFFKMKAYELI